jgi:hypothetical protein
LVQHELQAIPLGRHGEIKSLIYLTRSIPMEGMIGDAVQGPETKIETGADQSSAISIHPIGHCLRRAGRKSRPIKIRSHPPESLGDNRALISDYILDER